MKTVWTDGACSPNPGIGGWGWTDLKTKENSGGEIDTTNQRMEILAVIDALKNNPGDLKIISDSQYVIQGATIWTKNWIRNGWRRKKNKPVFHVELWKQLHSLMQGRTVLFEWVRGHSGDKGNERADYLATDAVRRLELDVMFLIS